MVLVLLQYLFLNVYTYGSISVNNNNNIIWINTCFVVVITIVMIIVIEVNNGTLSIHWTSYRTTVNFFLFLTGTSFSVPLVFFIIIIIVLKWMQNERINKTNDGRRKRKNFMLTFEKKFPAEPIARKYNSQTTCNLPQIRKRHQPQFRQRGAKTKMSKC